MSRPLRVASYNVHGCLGRDGRRDVARIVRILREIDADVIGLQEVESRHGRSEIDQAENLAAALGMACIEGPLLHHAERGWYGNALLTRLEVQAVRRVLFESYGVEARGAIVCDLRADDGTRWRVMTTHLDLRSRHRRRQFATLLDQLVPSPREPTALMGDFNEWWSRSRGADRTAAPRRVAAFAADVSGLASGAQAGPHRVLGLPAARRGATPAHPAHPARVRPSADLRRSARGRRDDRCS